MTDEYVAGLFDGEGWISFCRNKCTSTKMGSREYRFQLYAGLEIREKFIIEKLVERYGGTITTKIKSNPAHSTTYRWTLTGNNLHNFLYTVVLNHCLVKFDVGTLAFDISWLKKQQANKALTDDTYEQYCKYYNEMKSINKKGPAMSALEN